jgi:type IVB pilus formation R64 PilN family outer membrane protein
MTRVALITAALTLALAGCAPGLTRDIATARSDAERRTAEANERARTPQLYVPSTNAVSYTAPEPIQKAPAEPAALDALMTYSADSTGTLEAAAAYLAKSLQLPIRCTPDAVVRSRELHKSEGGEAQQSAGQFAFTARGRARDVLTQLTLATGTSWKWTGSEIRIYYLTDATFEIEATHTKVTGTYTISNASTTTSGGGSGSGSSGGTSSGGSSSGGAAGLSNTSAQTTTMDYSYDLFKDLGDAIKPMLTPSVGTAAVASTTKTVIVHDTQAVIDTIGAYIDGVNARLRRQVEIEVTLLAVEQSDGNTLGIDWNLMRQSTGGAYRIDALSTSNAPGDSQALQFTLTDPRSAWNGSKLLVDALRQDMHATVERSTTVRAMNNQRVAVQANEKDSFLVASQTVLVPNAGQTTNPIFVEQVTGLALSIVPVITGNHDVLLELEGSLSTPRAPKTVSVNNTTFQLPRSRDNQIHQSARLGSGSTLMLTGLDFTDSATDDRGIGAAKFSLFGGGTNASKARKTLVILITPRVTTN